MDVWFDYLYWKDNMVENMFNFQKFCLQFEILAIIGLVGSFENFTVGSP